MKLKLFKPGIIYCIYAKQGEDGWCVVEMCRSRNLAVRACIRLRRNWKFNNLVIARERWTQEDVDEVNNDILDAEQERRAH